MRRPAPAAALVHRRVGDLARDRGLDAPSYSTVLGIIAGIDPGLRTLALEGGTAYRDRFELAYRRSAARPNEQWQADHTFMPATVPSPPTRPAQRRPTQDHAHRRHAPRPHLPRRVHVHVLMVGVAGDDNGVGTARIGQSAGHLQPKTAVNTDARFLFAQHGRVRRLLAF